MRKLLIIYNIAFLFIGQIFIASIHHFEEHIHDDPANEKHECEVCIQYADSNNYILNSNEVEIYKHENVLFSIEFYNRIELDDVKRYHSRAPPV